MTKKVISVFVRSYIYSIFKVIVQFELNNQTSLRRIYFVLSQIDETPEWRIVNWIAETLIFQTVDLAHSEICLVLGANPRQCLWCHVLSRMSWVNSLHMNFNNKKRKKGTNIIIRAKFWNNHDNGTAYVTFIQISQKYVLILLQLCDMLINQGERGGREMLQIIKKCQQRIPVKIVNIESRRSF